MQTEKISDELYYCTTCGAANKISAVICTECENKIVTKHYPLADFLKKRIKGELTGTVTENLFKLIRKYLYSHLYGVVLTVSVVTTGVVAAYNATPHIKKVTSFPVTTAVAEEKEEEQNEKKGVFELTEDDIMWLKHVVTAYDAELDNTIRSGEAYYSDDDEYTSGTQLWAENNIEGYSFKGRHEMYDNPIASGQDELDEGIYNANYDNWYEQGFEPTHYRYAPIEGTLTGSEVESELGHTLLENGYDVMQVDYYCLTYNCFDGFKDYKFNFEKQPPADKTPYEMLRYKFLLTRRTGEERWHIAEEVLVQKTGGPKYLQ